MLLCILVSCCCASPCSTASGAAQAGGHHRERVHVQILPVRPRLVRLRWLKLAPPSCCGNRAFGRVGRDARRRQPLHLPVHYCSRLQAVEWAPGRVLQLIFTL